MNYEQALRINVRWEKTHRPEIKSAIENCKISAEFGENKIAMTKDDIAHFEAFKKGRDEWMTAMEGREGVLHIPVLADAEEKEIEAFAAPLIAYLGDANPSRILDLYHENPRNLLVRFWENGFLEKTISSAQARLKGHTLAVKEQKKEILFFSYVYNIDPESAEKHFDDWKNISYLAQEFMETGECDSVVEFTQLQDRGQGTTTSFHNGEDAYNEFCKREKEVCELGERLIKNIKLLRDIVKPILKAGRRMNKRKGKKNRG